MSKIRVQVSLPRQGNLAEDTVVNTYHFEDDQDASLADTFGDRWPGLLSRLTTWYQWLGNNVMSNLITGEVRVKAYDMAEPIPRAPKAEATFAIDAAGASLPAECAIVLSMEGQRVSGVAMGRRRGRVFLGPVLSGAVQNTGGGPDLRVASGLPETMIDAARTMAVGSGGSFRLAIYSPTQANSLGVSDTPDSAWNDVTTLRVDNAIDTIRKRGQRPTERRQGLVSGGPIT